MEIAHLNTPTPPRPPPTELYMIPPCGWNERLGSLVKKEAYGLIRQYLLLHGIKTRFKSSLDLVIAERRYCASMSALLGNSLSFELEDYATSS